MKITISIFLIIFLLISCVTTSNNKAKFDALIGITEPKIIGRTIDEILTDISESNEIYLFIELGTIEYRENYILIPNILNEKGILDAAYERFKINNIFIVARKNESTHILRISDYFSLSPYFNKSWNPTLRICTTEYELIDNKSGVYITRHEETDTDVIYTLSKNSGAIKRIEWIKREK